MKSVALFFIIFLFPMFNISGMNPPSASRTLVVGASQESGFNYNEKDFIFPSENSKHSTSLYDKNLNSFYFYGIYSGKFHSFLAKKISLELLPNIQKNQLWETDKADAILNEILSFEKEYFSTLSKNHSYNFQGASLLCLLIGGGQLQIFQAGDIQLLIKQTNGFEITTPNNLTCRQEYARITNLTTPKSISIKQSIKSPPLRYTTYTKEFSTTEVKTHQICNNFNWLDSNIATQKNPLVLSMNVEYNQTTELDTTRGLGMFDFRPYFSSRIKHSEIDIEDNFDYLLLGSSGLWDVMSTNYISSMIDNYLCSQQITVDNISKDQAAEIAQTIQQKATSIWQSQTKEYKPVSIQIIFLCRNYR